MKRHLGLFISLPLLACCVMAQSLQTHEVTLPSGKKIKVIAEGQVQSTVNGSILGLMLKYQTDLKVSDVAALRKEADEIWPVFNPDVERLALRAGIISANEATDDITSKGYNFVFEKQNDGSWRCLDDKPKTDSSPKHKK
jgi:hypothetical protein